MTKNFRVWNVTKGYSLKRGAALRAIENCSAEWVEEGVSIRNLTLAESIVARNHQAYLREPMAYPEGHGLRFDPPVSGIPAKRREGILCWEASQAGKGNLCWLNAREDKDLAAMAA